MPNPTNQATIWATAIATVLAGGGTFVAIDKVTVDDIDRRLIRAEERLNNLPPPALLLRINQVEMSVKDLRDIIEARTQDRYYASTARAELALLQRQVDELRFDVDELEQQRDR